MIKHVFTSTATDNPSPPAGEVQPSHWNAAHDLSGMVINDVPGLTTALAGKAATKPGYYQSGSLIVPGGNNTGTYDTGAAAANGCRAFPLRVYEPVTVALYVYRTAAGTASAMKGGLYSFKNAAITIPDALVFDLGSVTIGAGIGAYQGSSVTIPAGYYQFVQFFDANTPTLRRCTVAPDFYMHTAMETEIVTGTQNPVVRADNTITYPGSLPNPLTTSGWTVVSGSNALVTAFLKVI